MKQFLKDWWPLLLVAAWLLWRIHRGKQVAKKESYLDKQTVTLHDGTVYVVPDVCPRCGSPVDHMPGNKSLTAKCTNPECTYSVCYPKEGSEAGQCDVCGSLRHYRTVRSTADGCSIINRAACDNPDCKTHLLCY